MNKYSASDREQMQRPRHAYLAAIDSLTQIVLGAAVGELAAGRQLGNRAMLWGAVAGTVPDLDVTAGWVADPITNLAFHRCVTHSLYYAALASPVLAWMARALYWRGGRPEPGYLWRVWLPGVLLIWAFLVVGSYASPTPLEGVPVYSAIVALVTAAVPLAVWAFRSVRPRKRDVGYREVRYGRWLALFGLGIATHPFLDCFTTYGTQVLQPFSDLRVAWNTISVADPAYTLPFLVLVLVASRVLRKRPLRRRLVWAGLTVSSAYLAFTCYNLLRVRGQVAADLAAAGIAYERFLVTPTLLQNVLWNVTVDQGDTLRVGQLGLLDEEFGLSPKHMTPIARRGELLGPIAEERAVQVARWFSDDYFAVAPAAGDTLDYFDLRFGLLPGDPPAPVFGFQVYPRGAGQEWGFRQRPVSGEVEPGEVAAQLWERIRGRRR